MQDFSQRQPINHAQINQKRYASDDKTAVHFLLRWTQSFSVESADLMKIFSNLFVPAIKTVSSVVDFKVVLISSLAVTQQSFFYLG